MDDRGTQPKYVIDISNLCKTFRRAGVASGQYTTLKSLITGALSRLACFRSASQTGMERDSEETAQTTKALTNVTLRIPRGSSVGIIGRNGSGKSTLLKLITGIYQPSSGSVRVHGSMAALIELGAGFHPDFTGRENVILGGVMQGLRRAEIEALLPRITEFAELEDYIDEPVRTYSSGMFMRLGFSLSVHLEPEILLVDEVLAVGDAGFNRKCKERIEAMRKKGVTLLMVTHDLEAVERWCDEALWLDGGHVKDRGDPRRVIDAYRQFIEHEEERELSRAHVAESHECELAHDEAILMSRPEEGGEENAAEPEARRWGSREVEILGVSLKNGKGEERQLFHPHDGLSLEIQYLCHQDCRSDVVFGIGVERNDGSVVFGTNSAIEGWDLADIPTGGVFSFFFPHLHLASGQYSIDVAVHRQDGYPFDYQKSVISFVMRVEKDRVGIVDAEVQWKVR